MDKRYVAVLMMFALIAAQPARAEAQPPIEPMPRTELMQRADPGVFVHVMVSFRTPEGSGDWNGWDFSNEHVQHDPQRRDEAGRRDIASVFYPASGVYDQTDPDLAEYHCQLVKIAEMDGFFLDLGYYHDPKDEQELIWKYDAAKNYIETMQRYGLRGALVYEEKFHWIYSHHITERAEAVRRARRDMDAWLKLFEPVQVFIGDRPLVGFFSYQHEIEGKGISRLEPEEMAAWRQSRSPRPVTMTQWLPERYYPVHEGWMLWVLQSNDVPADSELRKYADARIVDRLLAERYAQTRTLIEEEAIELAVTAVWPGFDDSATHGWGNGKRLTPREDGQVYETTWRYALASDLPIVQVVTWNDWFEGTIIEPSLEHGTRYLEMTRRFAAEHKGMAANDANLALPLWIYRLRRRAADDAEATDAADRASTLIADGRYDEAAAVMQSWRDRYDLDRHRSP